MKKFLLFIAILLSLSSCDSTVSVREEDRAKVTTLEVLQNVDTTLQVSIINDYNVYILKNDVVVAKARAEGGTVVIVAWLFGIIIGIFIMALIFIN
jgi:hypothetical protein